MLSARWLVVMAVLFSVTVVTSQAFAEDVPQSFTLDGRLFNDPQGTVPLEDALIRFKVQILDEAETCVLYEEEQDVNTATSKGYFSVRVGSAVGSARRTTDDSANTMATIFQNVNATNGKLLSNGNPCAVPAVAGKKRFVRITVSPNSLGGAGRVLAPNLTIDSVPNAVVAERAESVQGFRSADLLKVNTTATNVLTQSNLESLFTSSTRFNSLSAVVDGTSSNYVQTSANGARLPVISGAPAMPAQGSIWFDTGDNRLKFYDGTSPVTLSTSGGAGTVTSVTGTLPISVATTTTTPVISIATAGVATTGALSSTDWGIFNAKLTSPLTTKGDLLTRDGTTHVRLPVGTDGQVVVADAAEASGLRWTNFSVGNLRTAGGAAQFASATCTASQTLTWSSLTNTFTCSNIAGLDAAVITTGTIAAARLPAGASYWTAATGGINYAGGNVGIGTTTPGSMLEVAGDINLSSGASRTIRVAPVTGTAGNTLYVGAGSVTSGNGSGGSLQLTGGDGSSTGDGGGLNLFGGSSGSTGNGGMINIFAGSSNGVGNAGANVNISGGSSLGGAGGSMTFNGGNANGGGNYNGGDISLIGGSPSGTGVRGNIRLAPTGGQVAIGNTAPTTALDLSGAMTFRATTAPAATAAQGKIYYDTALNRFRVSQNGGAYTDLVSAGGSLSGLTTGRILKATSATSAGDSVITELSGRIGVNQATPTLPFHTTQSTAATDVARFDVTCAGCENGIRVNNTADNNGSGSSIFFDGNDGGGSGYNYAKITGYRSTSALRGALVFWTRDDTFGVNARSIITDTGLMGVGNIDPTSRLDVSGAITQRGMAAPGLSPAGQGRIYFDSGMNRYRISQNGSAYADLVGGGGTVTNVTGTLPISVATGTTTPVVSIATADVATTGALSSTDWGIFNAKLTSPLTTKGDLLTRDGTTHVRLPVGSDGQVVVADAAEASGLRWTNFSVGNLRTAGGAAQFASANCAATQTLTWSSLTNTFTCSNIAGLDAGVITTGTIAAARLPASASYWTSATGGINYPTGNVGIGTGTPTYNLDVAAEIRTKGGVGVQTGVGNVFWTYSPSVNLMNIGGVGASPAAGPLNITNTGLVGLGIATPNTILDVNGAYSQRGMAVPGLSPAGQGRIYFDSTSNTFRVSQNGSAYTDLVSAATGNVLNNGNSFGAAMTLGTNDNQNLNLETNNNVRTTVFNDGSVWIGDVAGINSLASVSAGQHAIQGHNSSAASLVVIGSPGNTSGELIRLQNRNGVYLGAFDVNGGMSLTGVVSGGLLNGATQSTGGNTSLEAARLTHEDSNSGGANGIGTYLSFNLETATDGTFRDAARIEGVLDDAANNSKDGSLRFYTMGPNAASGTANPTEKLRIDSAGNVGINATAPGAMLQVGTAGTSLGTMRLTGNTSGYVQLQTAAAAGSWTMTLPASAGSTGQALTTNGAGVTSWSTLPTNGGTFLAGDGSSAAPSISFLNDSNSGFYSVSGDVVMLSLGGFDAVQFTNGFIDYYRSQRVYPGSITEPSYGLAGNSSVGTGMFSPATNAIGFTTNEIERVRIDATGQVGIGTTAPGSMLQLGTAGTSLGTFRMTGSTSGYVQLQPAAAAGSWTMTLPASAGSNGQALTTNGAGVTSWSTVPTNGGTFLAGDGTWAAPSISFANDTNTGFYRNGNDEIGITLAGIDAAILKGTVFEFYRPIFAANGTSGTPALGIADNGSTGTGFSAPTANVIATYSNGVERMRILANGNVGIGATAPGSMLQLGTAGTSLGTFRMTGNTSGYVQLQPAAAAGSWTMTLPASAGSNGQALITNGSGVTSWSTVPTNGGTFLAAAGTAAAPGFAFAGNTNTGLTNPYAGALAFSVGGNERFAIDNNGFYGGDVFLNPYTATAANPTYTFGADQDTGMYTPSANAIRFATGSADRMSITSAGQVGIATTAPGAMLQLGTAGTSLGTIRMTGNTSGYVQLQPAAAAGSWTMTLPVTAGTNGQALTTNGSGVTSWSSVPVNGGTFLAGDGTDAAPTYSFTSDPDTGILRSFTNEMAFTAGGTRRFILSDVYAYITVPFTVSQNSPYIYTSTSGSQNYPEGTHIESANGNTDPNTASLLKLRVGAGSAWIGAVNPSSGSSPALTFVQQTGGSAYAERMRISEAGSLGIGTAAPGAKLDVTDTSTTTSGIIVPRAGNFTGTNVNGMIRYNTTSTLFEFRQNGAWVNYTTVSDGRLKTNVAPVTNGLDIVNQLNPVFYDWDRSNPKASGFDEKHQVGFIAQEVEKVLPEVVNKGEDSYRSLEYGKMVAVVVDAVKSLYKRVVGIENRQATQAREIASVKAENQKLKQENAEMKSRLDKIEALLNAK